jgi:hypothetical protein
MQTCHHPEKQLKIVAVAAAAAARGFSLFQYRDDPPPTPNFRPTPIRERKNNKETPKAAVIESTLFFVPPYLLLVTTSSVKLQ